MKADLDETWQHKIQTENVWMRKSLENKLREMK